MNGRDIQPSPSLARTRMRSVFGRPEHSRRRRRRERQANDVDRRIGDGDGPARTTPRAPVSGPGTDRGPARQANPDERGESHSALCGRCSRVLPVPVAGHSDELRRRAPTRGRTGRRSRRRGHAAARRDLRRRALTARTAGRSWQGHLDRGSADGSTTLPVLLRSPALDLSVAGSESVSERILRPCGNR